MKVDQLLDVLRHSGGIARGKKDNGRDGLTVVRLITERCYIVPVLWLVPMLALVPPNLVIISSPLQERQAKLLPQPRVPHSVSLRRLGAVGGLAWIVVTPAFHHSAIQLRLGEAPPTRGHCQTTNGKTLVNPNIAAAISAGPGSSGHEADGLLARLPAWSL